ncbi:MAG: TolC family protein, partial [Parachlamydiaceae bacterium]
MGFQFSYEFDFWGKNQNRMRAAIGEHEAAWAEREQARLILSISVADAYFQYLILQKRENVYERIIELQAKLIEIEEEKKKRNISSNLQILPLKQSLESYVAARHKATQNKEAAYYKLQALVNPDFNEPIELKALTIDTYLPLPIPKNIHLDLLHRRPDLTALKWKVEAKDRERLSAQAEFYPDFQFLGLVGIQTISPQKLFRGDSLYGNWGPAVHLPIFTGGALSANYLAKDEETLLAILEYEQGVLDAVSETLIALSETIELNERYEANRRREEESARFEALIKARQKNNLATTQDLIRSEIQTYLARDEKFKMEGLLFRGILDVIRSVGG